MQHGHMDQVGYDTYCKLLDEVIKERKGIKTEEEKEITIDINVSSYIPDEYIEDNKQKIEIYQNIALAKTEDDLKNVVEDINDRYGKAPKEVYNLLEIARIKSMCLKIGIIKIMQRKSSVVFYIDDSIFSLNINNIVKKYGNKIRFSPGKEAYITYKLDNDTDVISEIKEFLNGNNK